MRLALRGLFKEHRLGFLIETASRALFTSLAVNLVVAGCTRPRTKMIRDGFCVYKRGQVAVERMLDSTASATTATKQHKPTSIIRTRTLYPPSPQHFQGPKLQTQNQRELNRFTTKTNSSLHLKPAFALEEPTAS
jgi:hypothetical protein